MSTDQVRFTDAVARKGLDQSEQVARQRRREIERQVKAACAEVSGPSRPTEKCAENYRCRLQGEIAERAMKTLGGESLNETYGRNFPVYDHRLGREWASVKTHMPNDAYRTAYLDNYAHDLRVAMGETLAKQGKYQGWHGPTFAAGRVAHLEPGDGGRVERRQQVQSRWSRTRPSAFPATTSRRCVSTFGMRRRGNQTSTAWIGPACAGPTTGMICATSWIG